MHPAFREQMLRDRSRELDRRVRRPSAWQAHRLEHAAPAGAAPQRLGASLSRSYPGPHSRIRSDRPPARPGPLLELRAGQLAYDRDAARNAGGVTTRAPTL